MVARYAKHHLPNYGVFDEYRYFVPGDAPCVVRVHGVDVALAICEDLWQDGGPVAATRDSRRRAAAGHQRLAVRAQQGRRAPRAVPARRAAEAGCALAYVNMVGGQDELVFDGDSIVVDADGELLARAPQFAEELLVVDLDLPAAADGARPTPRVTSTAAGAAAPPYVPLRGRRCADRLSDDGGGLRRRSSPGCATTSARTASAR